MTITTTTTTSTLFGLMSKTQRLQAETNRPKGSSYTVSIYNPDVAKRVFYEIGTSATTNSTPLAISGGKVEIVTDDLAKINLICETSSTDIIIQVN